MSGASSYYKMDDYTFLWFERSGARYKKYAAIIRSNKSGRKIRLNFGDTRYGHYKDVTGLGMYDKMNHNDDVRRASYRARHKPFIKNGYYSPGYFAYNYLW